MISKEQILEVIEYLQVLEHYPKKNFGNAETARLAKRLADSPKWRLAIHLDLVKSCGTFDETMQVFIHHPAKSQVGACCNYLWLLSLATTPKEEDDAKRVCQCLYGKDFEPPEWKGPSGLISQRHT